MNTDVLVWAPKFKWIFGLLWLVIVVWAVDVVKRAITGKGEGIHWHRIFHWTHQKKGT